MSHNIYQTEGFVIKSFNFGEANRFFYFFTKDFGLLQASAQGIREAKSKLRYSLQDFSYTKLDLVRGRNVWRVINAERSNHLNGVLENKHQAIFLAKIFNLLHRLLQGEDKNSLLFEDVSQSVIFLNKEDLNSSQLLSLEVATVLRILNHLGYWGRDEQLNHLAEGEINHILLEEVSKNMSKVLRGINESLKESQL